LKEESDRYIFLGEALVKNGALSKEALIANLIKLLKKLELEGLQLK
jgi:hypothetical protein